MPIVTLDYNKVRLAIECNTPVEEKYRVKAVSKEPWTVDFIESIPAGAIFWDIGANVGPYSLIAASRGLNVVAIEPGFNNFAALCRNLAMNSQLERTLVLPLALSDRSGYDWFHFQDPRSGAASHILGGARKQYFHRQLVRVATWDEIAATLPLPKTLANYAKIDVDGGELAALRGGVQVLASLQGLLIEMAPAVEGAITELVQAAGLKLAARFDERNGQPIGVAYGRFERG